MIAKVGNAIRHIYRSWFRRRELEDDLAQEIELHIEELAEDYQRQGLSREKAMQAARIRFGGIERIREECRESWTIRFVSNFWRDIRLAVRSLLKSRGVTVVAILTLALGIGVNTSMFSMLNGILLRPLSYPKAEQLFRLYRSSQQESLANLAYANFEELARSSEEVAELAGFTYWGFTLSDGEQPAEMPQSVRVTANFFDVLGIRPERGRGFDPSEDVHGGNNVIVISNRYWRTRFAEDPDIVGRLVSIDGQPVEIVGVLPPDDDTPRVFSPIDLFRPLGVSSQEAASRSSSGLNINIVGRYRDGVTPEQANARFDAVAARLAADHPSENSGIRFEIRSLKSTSLMGTGRSMTYLLTGLSGFVLLIACLNLANILLVRAIGRVRELTVRSALGASKGQLVRPLIMECLVLATGGGFVAMLISIWTSKWLALRFSNGVEPVDFSPDGRVLAFAGVASLVTALVFGAGPVLWASRINLNDSLKTGARGSSAGKSRNRYRQLLIVSQFALALVLLAGSGFFIRGVERLTNIDSGWKPERVVEGVLNLATPRYNNAETIISFHEQLRQKLLRIPGVESACNCYSTPLFGGMSQRAWVVQGREMPRPGEEIIASVNGVSTGYFETMGTRLLSGRRIDERDQLASQRVVVINESMARSLFPNESPIGKTIGQVGAESETWAEIVGVVEDTRPMFVGPSSIVFEVYKPYVQEAWQYGAIAVRVANPEIGPTLIEPIREAVASLDSELPVLNLMPTPQRIQAGVGFWKTVSQLLFLFAGLGVSLAAVGIYGVITRLVVQRTEEIGIRMALGARAKEIFWLVMRNVIQLTMLGVVVGLVGSYFLQRYLAAEMPAIGRGSPFPIVVAAVALVGVALVACQFPARRAARIDPTTALAAE